MRSGIQNLLMLSGHYWIPARVPFPSSLKASTDRPQDLAGMTNYDTACLQVAVDFSSIIGRAFQENVSAKGEVISIIKITKK
jgi:hypothetical protein